MSTLYAGFKDAASAEKAAGALLDFGADRDDISIVANESTEYGQIETRELPRAESHAKQGLTPTTPADVATGAIKGAAAGATAGLAVTLAVLFVPGIGWVLGGGALAAALAGTVGAAAAGSVAGGVAGWLIDQGVMQNYATRYAETVQVGGAILAVKVPSGELSSTEAEKVLAKYGAMDVGTFYTPQETQVVAHAVDTTRITEQ